MAILISMDGKHAETNRNTMARLALEKGDKLVYRPDKKRGFTWVYLNDETFGRLFDSHEAAINYLANRDKKFDNPKARPASIMAKRNPSTDLTPLFSKPIGKALREQILRELRARKGTLNDALKDSAKKHGVAAIRIYTIAKQAGLTTKPKR